MKINDVSQKTGLPISTLRFYERKNLIPGTLLTRDVNNYRIYNEKVVDYLEDVKTLLSIGFTLNDLSTLNSQERTLTYEEKMKFVENKLKEIEHKRKKLEKSKKILSEILGGKAHFKTKC
ncbi:MerR family transcriptional regulator [Halalkalibacterium halodurans]|uniref:MerR family transcriptional regulator n=1 Tax=Halalkalibacterium halodurans TaxID=86665 RepID=UPI002E23820C|nr:MerR family transcriptional regulator [Halalkalibacterium halodurans]MED4084156.1 MerR family transcriptional regulator [Halalkalibacterium halodurans]MED4104634.1 MerR family transcriptional regulator [Halalkalibacterium halodurans]MED4108362.1 MerR family transcriptional regulator [Halalkalibacterium halodurans]MED4147383.1 MerR family transcriptional regulator [Halalkalibacterium halodurans]